MTPADLRTARQSLDWSQQRLADALGLTREFIGRMERGAKPIEKRTALAVERLLDLHTPTAA